MNDYDGGLDDELATLTDRLLRGEAGGEGEVPGDLRVVVQRLHRALTVDHAEDDEPRARIRQSLVREWSRQYPVRAYLPEGQQKSRWMPWQMLRRMPRVVQLMASAAVLVVALVGMVMIAGDSDGDGLQGTASGSGATLLPLTVVVIAVIIAAGWWIWRKRH